MWILCIRPFFVVITLPLLNEFEKKFWDHAETHSSYLLATAVPACLLVLSSFRSLVTWLGGSEKMSKT